jgi:hypothetical protein
MSRFCAFAAAVLICNSVSADDLKYKQDLFSVLIKQVPGIMRTYDKETGRFGKGIWICRDQDVLYPLAVAYSYESESNPFHKEKVLLEAIMKGGDALIEDMDEKGQWMFRKKDGSTWGMVWMPWTYSRWVRAFGLIQDDMPPDRRERWEKALSLGYGGIKEKTLGGVHNIPTHHAMGLYAAGKALGKKEWCDFAAGFMMKAIAEQSDGGYWSENVGPVVNYNFVYLDALGTYYKMSGDERVLPALQRSAAYHLHFTYPDGTTVETIDERNPYHKTIATGNVGFTFTPDGRAYLKRQWDKFGWTNLSEDVAASLLLYGDEGPIAETGPIESENLFVLHADGGAKAATLRNGPWFACLSAYTAPLPKNRWIQDRQNLVSLFHDKVGLFLGGGNTKLQPAWSNFTVGDTSLLRHEEGDTDPDFVPKGELHHIPSSATLVWEHELGLDLDYDLERCRIRLKLVDDKTMEIRLEATAQSGLPVEAHLTLLPFLGKHLETAGGHKSELGETAIDLDADTVGGRIVHASCCLHVPGNTSLHWPALPHNPYRKDGDATVEEGRIEVRIPFEKGRKENIVRIEVTD